MYIHKATNADCWKGRNTNQQEYFYQFVQTKSFTEITAALDTNNAAILGYCVDEGVQRNQGRAGTATGPDAIRNMLAKTTVHQEKFSIADFGNLYCVDDNLEAVQDALADAVYQLLHHNYFPIILGGGHDIAFGHFKGIYQKFPDKKIGIINFDAHFDLRVITDLPNSGTPFLQIQQQLKNDNQSFNYLCLGIREESNTKTLFDTAKKLNVHYVLRKNFKETHWDSIKFLLNNFLKNNDIIYITIDLDGFSSAYAPGVSAPSPMGFDIDIFFKTLCFLMQSPKIISIDIAEYNPTYDIDNHTARLASSIIWKILHEKDML